MQTKSESKSAKTGRCFIPIFDAVCGGGGGGGSGVDVDPALLPSSTLAGVAGDGPGSRNCTGLVSSLTAVVLLLHA